MWRARRRSQKRLALIALTAGVASRSLWRALTLSQTSSVDDAEFGDLRHGPDVLGVWAGHPLARRRILDVAQPVPDQTSDVEFVVQDAGPARAVSADGGVAPEQAARTGNAFVIETAGDRLRRQASREFREYAPDDGGLGRIDRPLAGDGDTVDAETSHHLIAVTLPAAGPAGLDAAAQAATGLVGEVLEEELVHRALQADMQLADLALARA